MITLLVTGATFIAIVVAVLAVGTVLAAGRTDLSDRLARDPDGATRLVSKAAADADLLRDTRFSGIGILNRVFRRSGYLQRVALELARARIPVRAVEFVVLRLLAFIGTFLLMTLLTRGDLLPSLAGALLAYFVPLLYLKRKQRARLRALESQLVDAITLISNSLKSGFGFQQGLELVARDMAPPISEEFGEVVQEMRLGVTPEDALRHLIEKVPSYDVYLLATAVIVQRTVGGNLSEVLDTIVHTIRERMRILGEVRARTAQGRLSGNVLVGWPVVLAVATYFINRDHVMTFFNTQIGNVMLAMIVFLLGVGYIMIRRIVDIRV